LNNEQLEKSVRSSKLRSGNLVGWDYLVRGNEKKIGVGNPASIGSD